MITKNFVTIWFCNAPLYCLNLSLSSSDIGSLSAHPNTFKVQTDLSSFFMRLVICGQVYKVNDIYNLSIIYEFQNQNWANSCCLYSTYYRVTTKIFSDYCNFETAKELCKCKRNTTLTYFGYSNMEGKIAIWKNKIWVILYYYAWRQLVYC